MLMINQQLIENRPSRQQWQVPGYAFDREKRQKQKSKSEHCGHGSSAKLIVGTTDAH
jgi:hypothetical protein